MSLEKQKNNIIQYKKQKKHWRIEHFVFLAIFIYLICNIISVNLKDETSIYQVHEGSIINDTAYTGIAIRDESLYTSEGEGYIQYYQLENSKISTGSNVYTLSKNELELDSTTLGTDDDFELSNIEKSDIFSKVQAFNMQFNEQNFSEVLNLKQDVKHIVDSAMNDNTLDYLNEVASQNSASVQITTSTDDGVVLYQCDGYELFQESDLTPDTFNKNLYDMKKLLSGEFVESGSPVFKLITDEDWCIYILLSDEDTEKLANISKLEVNFTKDNLSMLGDFSIIKTGDAAYGKLEFDSGMVRYAAERYLDIELVLDNQEGLKIPVSSVVEKEFYQIPSEFIDGKGVLLKKEDGSLESEPAKIYYNDSTYAYISTDKFKENQVLGKTDSMDTYTLSNKGPLTGVYIVNRGYAVFQYVNILTSSDEYHIVELTSSGLDNYDNIALYGERIKENDIIF